MRFTGVADNPPRIFDNQRWTEWFAKRKGQRFECELQDEAAIRSNRQNRFLNGPVVDEFARVWHKDGWRIMVDDQPHALPKRVVRARLLNLFCPHDAVAGPNGEIEMHRQSTADMSKLVFSRLLDEMGEYLVHKEGEKGMLPSPEEWNGEE